MRCVRAITGICHAAVISIAAAFVVALCLALSSVPAYADEGGAGLSAEDEDMIVVSVPTTVPCKLLSDGTVVTPTSWKIENSGSTPARLAMASAKPAYEDISISAKAKANGSTLLDYSAGFASYDPTLIVPAKGSLDVSWSVSPIDPVEHADLFEQASQNPVALLSASFLFCAQSTEPDASDSVPFAVYSEDDASLTFYKRRALPSEGSMFEGKTATAVYTNIQNTKSTPLWKGIASKIKRVAVVDDGIAPQTMYAWFFTCDNLLSVNISKLDTSKTTSLGYAFSGCKSLTEIDLSALNTSSVRSFADVFQDCSSLRSVNLAGWNTSSGDNFSQMFYQCASLEELDISSFETRKVITFKEMFRGCSSLSSLNVSMFDTSAATDVSQAFYGCGSLTELDLSKASTAKVETFYGMFSGCSGLTRIDLSLLDTSSAKNLSYLFADCSKLESVNVSSIKTSTVTDFNHMFSGCSSLKSLDLSSFDTSAAKDLSCLFYGCSSLASLNLSSFDTSNVEQMANLFYGCSKLAEVTLGKSFAWVGSKCFLPQPNATVIPGADGLWHAASDGAAYLPPAVPGNKADTYRAVAPCGEGDAVEDGSDVSDGAQAGEQAGAATADAAQEVGSGGAQAGENAGAATGAGGESTPNGESSATAAEGPAAAEREDHMTALSTANPSTAAPSVPA
ncbi:MAG: BspA family leucine-rich repeat surface protein [Collinsella aerofaciens]|nr:BspA family leucine-rich repeat surface protein [Collinsella aerofaciens]